MRSQSHVVVALFALTLAGCCKESTEEKEATVEAGEDSNEVPPAATAEAPSTASAAAEDPMAPDATLAADAATTTPTVTKPPTASGANQVKACCSALQSAAGKASRVNKPTYESGAAVCSGMVKSVEKGTISASGAKQTIRAQLQRVSIPSACR